MTSEANSKDTQSGEMSSGPLEKTVSPERLPLPGLAAISLYLLLLAGVGIFGVVTGQFKSTVLILTFSSAFITASLGLFFLFRWAWALTLAAVVLLASLFMWKFAAEHEFPFLIQGLLNLVFVLYLVRIEVRRKLR